MKWLGRRGGAAARCAALAFATGCRATLPGPAVCDATEGCGRGQCVVGRCREPDTIPASTLGRKVSIAPTQVAVLGDGGDPAGAPAFALGAGARTVAVLVTLPTAPLTSALGERARRLARPSNDERDADRRRAAQTLEPLQRAVLVFEPAPTGPMAPGRFALMLAEIVDPWSPASVASGAAPRTSDAMRLGAFEAAPRAPLRVDVTELVRGWARGAPTNGLALIASGDTGGRASYLTADADLGSPRLDVYLAPDGTEPVPEASDPSEEPGDDARGRDAGRSGAEEGAE